MGIFRALFRRNTTYPRVHEDEVHLTEGEHHLEDGIDPAKDLVARRVPGDLEEGAQLEAAIDHGAQAEGCKKARKR